MSKNLFFLEKTKKCRQTNLSVLFSAFFLLMVSFAFGQITIASDGLNNATTLFTLSGGTYYTGNTPASGASPASSPYAVEGTHSRGVANGTATLTSSNINTTGYSGIELAFRLVAFSDGSGSNGVDGTDIVTVEVSPNGGTNWFSTVRVLGNTNARWSYSGGTGIATTAYDGNATSVDFTPAGGGVRTTDGYSTVKVTSLPASSNLRVRITLLNNDGNERWAVDDFKVTGTSSCSAPSNPSGTLSQTPSCGSVSLNYTLGAGENAGEFYWQTAADGEDVGNNTLPRTVTTAGTYYLRRQVGGCWSANSISINVASVPNNVAITTQPVNRSISENTNTTFSVVATNAASYQWQVNTGSGFNNITDGGVYSGATTATLTLTNVPISFHNNQYRVNLTSTSPCVATLISAARTLSVGSATGQEINVKGNGQTITDNDIYPSGTDHTSFGTATLTPNQTIVRTFTIENTGTYPLSISGVTITGTGASSFAVTSAPASSVAAGSSTTFQVTFDPTTQGSKNATINIANNDSNENPYNFNITGTAKGSNNIYVSGKGNDIIKGSTTVSLDNGTNFGSDAVGETIQRVFQVSNFSGGSRYLSDVSISGADAAQFSIIAQVNDNALSNNNTDSFAIVFTPTSTGIKNATITFNVYTNSARTTTDPVDPTITFAIQGKGNNFIACTNGPVTTIAQQDFETSPASPVWNYTVDNTGGGVTVVDGTNRTLYGGASTDAHFGSRSFKFTGDATAGTYESTILTLDDVDTSIYNNINLSFRLGMYGSSSQGIDINDLVYVEVSTDGGVNWSNEAIMSGYSNSTFDINAAGNTGVFNAYYTGTNVGPKLITRHSNAGMVWTGTGAYTTFKVNGLPSQTGLKIRIGFETDRNDEHFVIDDLKIEGRIPESVTWNGSSWSATPVSNKKAIITGSFDSDTHGNIPACKCDINGVDVVIKDGEFFESQSDVKLLNGATLTVEHGGNFVQRDANALVPSITLKTLTRAIPNHAWVHRSSPVLNNGNIWSSIPFGNYAADLSSQPTNQYRSGSLFILNNSAWVAQTDDSNLVPGRGFIIRTTGQRFTNSPVLASGNTNNTTTATRPLNFTGIANNGDYEFALQSDGTGGTSSNHTTLGDQNLLGNPYPSAIDANDFLTANSSDIFGTIYIWTSPKIGHDGKYPHSSGFATYNGTMGVASGTDGSFTPTRFIAPGQGFQVFATCGDCTGKKIVFSNDMRETTETGGRKFAREKEVQDEKIYLSLKDFQTNLTSRIGIGYVEEATKGFDNKYDAPVISFEPYKFYSKVNDYKVIINGRPKFDVQDVVELGFEVGNENVNTFEISLDNKEGEAFNTGIDILLKDKVLNVVHNLSKSSKYAFVSSSKEVSNRFEILYVDTKPKSEVIINNKTQVAVNKGNLVVKSEKVISSVEVYDLAGSLVANLDGGGLNEVQSTIDSKSVYLVVKVTKQNGETETFKIVNK